MDGRCHQGRFPFLLSATYSTSRDSRHGKGFAIYVRDMVRRPSSQGLRWEANHFIGEVLLLRIPTYPPLIILGNAKDAEEYLRKRREITADKLQSHLVEL